MKKIRVGTRGSLLARTQTGMVVDDLRRANPEIEFELVIVKTTGDTDQKTSLASFGFQGVFIKELEDALYRDEIDLAVHSLKDVPHSLPAPMTLAAFIKREDPRDVLISKGDVSFEQLPQGAVIGTGSPRRILQLKKLRPDLQFKELRGNIDTRLSKVHEGDYDAVILASAGLNRIGYQDKVSQYFEFDQMIPAIAQGIITIETRANDAESIQVARSVEDESARQEALIERRWMERLGGGCKAPMAAIAQAEGGQLSFTSVLGHGDYSQTLYKNYQGPMSETWEWLEELALELESEARSLKIPLPSELPDHALLDDKK